MADELENESELELPLWRPLSYEESGLGRSNIVEPDEVEHKKFVLKCGNFVQAVYDAFDGKPFSPTVGQSLYDKDSLFSEVKLFDRAKFTIHSFLYAAGLPKLWNDFDEQDRGISLPVVGGVSNWIGYVAYEKYGENIDIFVVIRGTITLPEWIKNITARAVPANTLRKGIPDDAKVHKGWLSIYETPAPLANGVKKSLREQIHDSVKELQKLHENLNTRVVVTGHSLGGAVATLSAFDLAANKISEETEVTAIVFSTPPVGNKAFKTQVLRTGLKIHHYYVSGDFVTQYAKTLGFIYSPLRDYLDISSGGRELLWTKSEKYLNHFVWTKIPVNTKKMMHNLEVVLHLVAAYNGNMVYELTDVRRSPVLINKNTHAYWAAPRFWWKDKRWVYYDEDNQEWNVDQSKIVYVLGVPRFNPFN